MEFPSKQATTQDDIKSAILTACQRNDLDWYIGGQRITYQGISNAVNIQHPSLNTATAAPIDAESILRTIREDTTPMGLATLYELDGTETVHSQLGPMTAKAIPEVYKQGDTRQWQAYEIEALRRLLDGNCSRPVSRTSWNKTKMAVILEDLQNISESRRWPLRVHDYTEKALMHTLRKLGLLIELRSFETMGLGYSYAPHRKQALQSANDKQSLTAHVDPEARCSELPRQPQNSFDRGFQPPQQQQEQQQQKQPQPQPSASETNPNEAKPPHQQNSDHLPYYPIYPDFPDYNFSEGQEWASKMA
ncbi:hypothetical protein IFR05_004532 [Cadophora sp. M221]|nr:hypothetical protein IFR05_004532 [Cadophora sp. M221]